MKTDERLRGVSVAVAGAGLAGLTAARTLVRHGAAVTLIESRGRAGGRVWTARDGFHAGQHGELGADLIEESQQEILALANELRLERQQILRNGFGAYRAADGLRRRRSIAGSWRRLRDAAAPLVDAFRRADESWDGAVGATLGRRSVAEWLDAIDASPELRATARGLRGFFLADPEELSLLALIEQFASDEAPGRSRMFRLVGGNQRLPDALARALGDRINLRTTLRAVDQRRTSVRLTVSPPSGRQDRIDADFAVVTIPASLLRKVAFTPPLPDPQREAFARLPYGAATKTLLQFDRAVWRHGGAPRAWATDLPIGAVWDASEGQPGRPALLTLLAGGSASAETRALLARSGADGLRASLEWLVGRARLLADRGVSWEHEEWSRGGYAVFDRSFPPPLRGWLARPFGRIVFAGEHTSIRWQGYMNGAVESGRRAALEILAMTDEQFENFKV
jgi:monoamine oxidase